MHGHRLLLTGVSLLALSAEVQADTSPVAPTPALDRRSTISVGVGTYVIDGYLSSSPAVLIGPEVAYDRHLTSHLGVRGRLGAIDGGVDEIDGTAFHVSAGPVVRQRLSPRAALEGALMVGAYTGGLGHRMLWEDEAGPTAAVEGTLRVGLGARAALGLTGGYRVARTPNGQIGRPETFDDVVRGPVLRLEIGATF